LSQDSEPHVYLVYPQGNWIEVEERTPYLVIGETPYGKPILDRALTYDTPLTTALKLAYLSFDSTRASASDVGFPIDLITFTNDDRSWREAHYIDDDVRAQRHWWNDNLTRLAREMPDGPWVKDLLASPLRVVGKDPEARLRGTSPLSPAQTVRRVAAQASADVLNTEYGAQSLRTGQECPRPCEP
jgi:putative proteasome-type protease